MKLVLTFLIYFICIQSTFAYICEPDYVQYNGICYKFTKTNSVHYESQAACEAENATLATVSNAFVNSFVLGFAKNLSISSFWFGLYCPVDKRNHIFCAWDDGTKYNYNNFYPGDPSINYVNVAFIASSGFWQSVDGLTKRSYLCAKDPLGFTHPITTLPPTLAPPICQETPQIYTADQRRHGTIYSPGFPLNYAFTQCTYVINGPIGSSVEVEFPVLNLDFGSSLELFNAENATTPFHSFYGGSGFPTPVPQQLYQSLSNQMKIVFLAADAGRYNNVTIYSWEMLYGAAVPLK